MHYSVYTSSSPVPPKRRRRIWWIIGFSLFFLIGWFAAGPLLALRRIQDPSAGGSSFLGFLGNIVSGSQLKGEGDGRINIALLGVGGRNHPGGTLADTIQVVSINPKDKKVAVLSIPRDLQVTIPGSGVNKINYAHAYGEQNAKKTGGGPALTKSVLSTILGLPIHYYVRMDFEGFEKLVDALGGVDITVEKAINDPFYPAPDMVHYDPFSIGAGHHHLDGKTALRYVRSRETTSDFDRSRRQQQMLQALKEKALSLNILANPRKVNQIAGILGTHVKTDLSTWEIARLIEVGARDVGSYSVVTRVLSTGAGEPLVSTNQGGYYLVPRTGDFSEIQRIARDIFKQSDIKTEQARIEIINASGQSKVLTDLVASLKSEGYTVTTTRTADSTIRLSAVYDYSGGTKPTTAESLSERFGLTPRRESRPSGATVDFSLLIGTDFQDRVSYAAPRH